MRLTYHNGRAGRDGVYSTRHNDRNFDASQDDHIDDKLSAKNIYWHCYHETDPDLTFDAAEQKFYELHFSAALDERNERSRKQGHYERVQSIDDYRKSRKSCPEETEYAVGKLGDSVKPELLQAIVDEHIEWLEQTYPQYKVIDVALHADERGVGHIHERHVWVAHDDAGREIVHQSRSLTEMGVERPDVDKKEGRHNNAKQTFTAICRQNLIELCAMHGLQLETEPKERSKSGLSLLEYQSRQEEDKALIAKAEAEAAEELRLIKEIEAVNIESETRRNIRRAKKELAQITKQRDDVRAEIANILRSLDNIATASNVIRLQDAAYHLAKTIRAQLHLDAKPQNGR